MNDSDVDINDDRYMPFWSSLSLSLSLSPHPPISVPRHVARPLRGLDYVVLLLLSPLALLRSIGAVWAEDH